MQRRAVESSFGRLLPARQGRARRHLERVKQLPDGDALSDLVAKEGIPLDFVMVPSAMVTTRHPSTTRSETIRWTAAR